MHDCAEGCPYPRRLLNEPCKGMFKSWKFNFITFIYGEGKIALYETLCDILEGGVGIVFNSIDYIGSTTML